MMSSIVERLRDYARDYTTTTHEDELITSAADLIEQQAERIKELDARYEHWFKEATKARGELAALRQRIADAPVVAWVIRNSESDMKGWIPAKVWADGEFQYPLISKEDLQK